VKAFVDSGGFSRDFGFFHEETDLMYRMAGRGWRVWFEPSAEVVHLCGHSTSRIYDGQIVDRYIPAKLLFLEKYGGPFSIPAFRLMMTGLLLARALGSLLRPTAEGGGDPGRRCFNGAMRATWRAPRPGEGHPSRGREGAAGPGGGVGGSP
jgi:N-acetylglucosaminyl-diphospho-decaprenol L-rhamnosyltransferase